MIFRRTLANAQNCVEQIAEMCERYLVSHTYSLVGSTNGEKGTCRVWLVAHRNRVGNNTRNGRNMKKQQTITRTFQGRPLVDHWRVEKWVWRGNPWRNMEGNISTHMAIGRCERKSRPIAAREENTKTKNHLPLKFLES